MAEISWIKLKTTMFDDEKIRLIQAVPESDAIIVIWIRLLVLAGKTNDDGLIY
ncbi:TPA: phage replisome organizer N-terminal domain-containing protein, partial [Enterococcus faecium]|nr:phage replisome organizer N-terminal domain-containing protein [Enterococcus faecium]